MADKKVTDVFKLLHRAPSSPFSFNLPLEKKKKKETHIDSTGWNNRCLDSF